MVQPRTDVLMIGPTLCHRCPVPWLGLQGFMSLVRESQCYNEAE